MATVHKPGESPGEGAYFCARCDWTIDIIEDDLLPFCANCGGGKDIRYFHVRRKADQPRIISPDSPPGTGSVRTFRSG